MSVLKIADKLSLPIEATTQTIAVLAKKGHGKTYVGQKLAEEIHKHSSAQVVVFDPVGNWWSLRLAADGKARWSDIPIFGGLHGDFPLPPEQGAFIAQLIVDHGTSAVLDTSAMYEAEKKRFVADFTEALTHLMKKGGNIVHLFLEEAQEFVPQVSGPDEARMKGALTRVVKLGRNWGIGVTMISQRPQAISKEVLNLTELLLVGQMTGAHERKAISDWVVEQGKKGETEEYLGMLPKLQRGNMVAWSPGWLDFLGVVKILPKETFDASATPKPGEKREQKQLKPIDVEALKSAMAAIEEEEKSNDPKELKKEIKRLKSQVKELEEKAQTASDGEDSDLLLEVFTIADKVIHLLNPVVATLNEIYQRRNAYLAKKEAKPRRRFQLVRNEPPAPKPFIGKSGKQVAAPKKTNGHVEKLTGKAHTMLAVIAASVDGLTRSQVAVLSVMRNSGTFGTYLSLLRTSGYVEEERGIFRASEAGLEYLRHFDADLALPETDNLVTAWCAMSNVTGKAKLMLQKLVSHHPRGMTRLELAKAVEMGPESGTFNTYLSTLRSSGLLDVSERGYIKASGDLFLGSEVQDAR